MYRKFLPFFIICETPLHAGSGSEVGVVDLPIQRERYTNFPKIEGSGIKGCIRESFENLQKKKELIDLVFGPQDEKDKEKIHAGSISFTDAKILLFPVKSLKGVFAWITCPMVLARFVEDMEMVGKGEKIKEWNLTNIINTVPQKSNVLISGKVVLEEFTFEVRENKETEKIAEDLSEVVLPNETIYNLWKEKLKKDLVVLSDDDFSNFVTTSTEVITRIRISSETGTVKEGALWTEEYLPQDTVLYSIVMTTSLRVQDKNKWELNGDSPDDEAQKVMEFFKKEVPKIIHIGGNQTIGKGIVRINLWEG